MLGFLVCLLCDAERTTAAHRPHIIMIVADDLVRNLSNLETPASKLLSSLFYKMQQ